MARCLILSASSQLIRSYGKAADVEHSRSTSTASRSNNAVDRLRGASYQTAQVKQPEAQVQVKEPQEEKIISGVINKPVVNVRQSPDLKAPVLLQLAQGSVVKIRGKQGGWYVVEWEAAGQVRKGWVADWLITIRSNEEGK